MLSVGCASREGRLRRAASEQVLGVAEGAAAVVLGPGIGREEGTRDLVRDLAQRIEAPLVIDADDSTPTQAGSRAWKTAAPPRC